MDRASNAIIVTLKDRLYIEEAKNLALSAGYLPLRIIPVKRFHVGKYAIGEGRAQILKEYCKADNTQIIIIDDRINARELYELSKYCKCMVIDREKLILEIFARRAQTEEAKLQVKLAELSYELPRIKEYVKLQRVGEQPGFFGYGAYETEKYYRSIKSRMYNIQEKISRIRTRRELHRLHRRKLGLPVALLTGYTSAGKTTLFNRLTGSQLTTSSSLFTTLTTTTRRITMNSLNLLITDTVGFISRLPHYMVEAFKSTLEEISFADLVLLILDVSDSTIDFKRKFDTCKDTLIELGVQDQKIVVILNKIDLVSGDELEEKKKLIDNDINDILCISASKGTGLLQLKEFIQKIAGRRESVVV